MSLIVKDLTKKYGEKTVVDHLSFAMEKPGVYALLGKDMEAELKKGSGQPLDRMAAALMAAAKGRGQRDDMTVMVVEVA